MRHRVDSFLDIEKDFFNTLEWMRGHGVRVDSGRMAHYQKVIKYWVSGYTEEKRKHDRYDLGLLLDSMFEVADFIEIYKAFVGRESDELIEAIKKLKMSVKGPNNPKGETESSNSARNYLLEVVCAAKFHHPDLGIQTIMNHESDVCIKIENSKYWIECKRISSKKKIEARTQDACDQLSKMFTKKMGASHRGIVLLDVTKVINPDNKILIADTEEEMRQSSSANILSFVSDNEHLWQKMFSRSSRKIMGIIVRYSILCSHRESSMLSNRTEWAFNPRADASDKSIEKMYSIYSLLNAPKKS
jgi:hypothetical protein